MREAILAATVSRPTFAERIGMAVRRALSPIPARYGALTAAGAAAALTMVALRNQSGPPSPVAYQPGGAAVIAESQPTEPAYPTTAGDGPRGIDALRVPSRPATRTAAADGVRRIDWKATARAGEPQVRRYQPAIAVDMLVALAFSRAEYGGAYAYDTMECALTAAASIAAHCASLYGRVTRGVSRARRTRLA